MEDATRLYVAGFGNADVDVILKSASITAIIIAILSAAAVLYLTNRKK
ncbi:MAG: hypothetical protein KBD06_01975 [Candidatus Pacebacteria bacterium]|nr:hypothetical protein [Candidatus Paceibacterota bacterium]